jgi:hypothetical protein
MQLLDGQAVFSAMDLVGFLACEHLTGLEPAGAARLVKRPIRPDPELDLIQQRVTPTVASEGWFADGRLTSDGEPGPLPPEVFSTAVQNLTGHRAISLPAGRSANGVPFGLQVTGPRHADDLLLDVAGRWESAHPWATVAPGYEPFTTVLG